MFINIHSRGRDRSALFLLILLLLASVYALPVMAQQPDANEICRIRCTPRNQENPFVEINANTGQVLAGATTFAEAENVKIIVSGKNPYKYEYQTNIKSSPLEVSLFTTFLGLIPGAGSFGTLLSGGPLDRLTERRTPQPGGPQAVADASPTCTELERNELNKLIQLSNDLRDQDGKIKQGAKEIEDARNRYNQVILDTDKDSLGSQAECQRVCASAAQLLPDLERLTSLQNFENDVKKLQETAKSLGEQVTKFKADHATCAQVSASELSTIERNVKDATERAVAALAAIETLKKAKPSFDLLGQRIRKTLVDNDAFSEERFPYTQAGPTAVKISLFRKNLREENAKEKEVGQVDLTLGQSRFSLSGGVGFSTIEDVTIVKRGDKFAEENESDLRPSLTLMLNARLHEVAGPVLDSIGLATGLVLTQRDSTTEAEFIVGPSMGFLDDRFLIILGYHTARVQSLRSKDIPANTTDIPVDKDWESGAMLAFTYKIR